MISGKVNYYYIFTKMATVLLILQSVIVIVMVLAIILQKNDGNSLAGLAGGGSGIISSRTSGNFLSKFTMILAIAFMVNSLALAKIAVNDSNKAKSLLQSLSSKIESKELEAPIAD